MKELRQKTIELEGNSPQYQLQKISEAIVAHFVEFLNIMKLIMIFWPKTVYMNFFIRREQKFYHVIGDIKMKG